MTVSVVGLFIPLSYDMFKIWESNHVSLPQRIILHTIWLNFMSLQLDRYIKYTRGFYITLCQLGRVKYFSQLMRLWYLSYRWPAKAQASLRICAVSPEPSLFAHMKYGSRRSIWPKIRHLTQLDGCACVFKEWVYGGRKVPKSQELAHLYITLGYSWALNLTQPFFVEKCQPFKL